jgi:hypothetical protein
MTKDKALDLALEALENSVDLVREDAYNAEKLYGNYPSRQGKVAGLKVLADDHEKAITAIKQALAAPVQEPVAWMFPDDLKRFETSEVYAEAYSIKMGSPTQGTTVPLYTTPPAAQPAVPLTDEQIEHLWETRVSQPCPSYSLEKSDWVQFARAIEAAHGITEKGQP